MIFSQKIKYDQEQDKYVVRLKKKRSVWRWILLGLLGLFLLPFLLVGGIWLYAYDLLASDPIPAVQDLPEPEVQLPEWNPSDPLPQPVPGCGVHFSAAHLTGRTSQYTSCWHIIFQSSCSCYGREGCVYVGAGLYPDVTALLPVDFHGMAIGKNTRFVAYSEPDFKGEKIMDVTGPLLINCSACTNKFYSEMWMPYTGELQTLFPLNRRKLESDFYGGDPLYCWRGSCKIFCVSDN